jgi:mediator of RNA polymerase II transcription subunit 10
VFSSLALSQSLYQVHQAATLLPPQSNKGIPEPLISYVENGRNPDIYTREFVELVRRMNQLARGKMHAFRDFRDTLAAEVTRQMPELSDDVRRVCEATGGGGVADEEQQQAQGLMMMNGGGGDHHQGHQGGQRQEGGLQGQVGNGDGNVGRQ